MELKPKAKMWRSESPRGMVSRGLRDVFENVWEGRIEDGGRQEKVVGIDCEIL